MYFTEKFPRNKTYWDRQWVWICNWDWAKGYWKCKTGSVPVLERDGLPLNKQRIL